MTGDRSVGMRFDVSRKALKGVDALRISFLHPDYPVSLTYASGSPYSGGCTASAPGLVMNDGNFNAVRLLDDLRLMVVSIRNVEYWRDVGGEGFLREADASWRDGFARIFPNLKPYAPGSYPVGKDGVDEVVVNEDGVVKIKYKNEGRQKIKPSVSVYLLNRYGAVLSRLDDKWKIKRLGPGEVMESKSYVGDKNAVYIDIETAH